MSVSGPPVGPIAMGVTVRELVVRARDGDRDAFGPLVVTISDRSYALAVRILRDRDLAEDALQGALIIGCRRRSMFGSDHHPGNDSHDDGAIPSEHDHHGRAVTEGDRGPADARRAGSGGRS